jgi:CBS domain-containing protein
VERAMHPQTATVDPDEPLERALGRLEQSGCPTLPVVRDGRVVGLLTLENISDLLMVRAVGRGVGGPAVMESRAA